MKRVGIVTDDFNRANGAIGANWTVVNNTDVIPVIVSNIVESSVTDGTVASGVYTAKTFLSNQTSDITVITVSTSSPSVGAFVRSTAGAGIPKTQYRAYINGPLGALATITIAKVVAGSETGLAGPTTFTVNSGDILRLEAIGTRLTAYLNDVAVLTATDGDITSGGPGIDVFAVLLTTSAELDNWAGADVIFDNISTNRLFPMISGV